MRHGDKKNSLGRTASHRDALMANLASQLIMHKRIVTGLAKAKALRSFVEPLITKTKANASAAEISHNHRIVFSHLKNKYAVKELFSTVAEKVASRPGGYTRIIKLANRLGDNAELAMIELVDFNDVYTKGNAEDVSAEPKKKTRRSGAKKSTTASAAASSSTTNTGTDTQAATDAAATTPSDASKASANNTDNDIEVIEGLGPKAAQALKSAGVDSFEKIASSTADALKSILDAAEGNFNAVDTTTWPQQAKLLVDGDTDGFKALTDKLKGGREVNENDNN